MQSGSELTAQQKKRIEENRQKALAIKKQKLKPSLNTKNKNAAKTAAKNAIQLLGNKYIDSGGGFLIAEDSSEKQELKIVEEPGSILKPDRPKCQDCGQEFADSYLLQTFDCSVCDSCRDNDGKHALITRTDAKAEFLLKDCDLDKREPPLKFILRKNPHNVRWGEMKLYLLLQVERRALEVFGTEEALDEERDRRDANRDKAKAKKYSKNLKALRMQVRSSLFDRTHSASHQHEFGPETYHEDDDNYTHMCLSCDYRETFEKM